MPKTLRIFSSEEVYGMIGALGGQATKKSLGRPNPKIVRAEANAKRRRIRKAESALRSLRISDLTEKKLIELLMRLMALHGITPGEELAHEIGKFLRSYS